MTTRIATVVDELSKLIQEKRPVLFNTLGSPASDRALKALESQLEQSIPDDLAYLYKWANGTSFVYEDILNQTFIPSTYFLSIKWSVKYWKEFTKAKILRGELYPIFDDLGGKSFCVELGKGEGSVWIFDAEVRDPTIVFLKLSDFLSYCSGILEAGFLSSGGLFAIDEETACEIGYETSGGLDYWKAECGF